MNGQDLLAFSLGFLLAWWVFAPRRWREEDLTVTPPKYRVVETDIYGGVIRRNLDLEVDVVEAIKKRNIANDDDENRLHPITLTEGNS